jgi:hypothetical protein
VSRIREKKNAYRILARKLEGNRPLKRKRPKLDKRMILKGILRN